MNESKKDMENIQKNLEQFLDAEIRNSIDSGCGESYMEFQDSREEAPAFKERKAAPEKNISKKNTTVKDIYKVKPVKNKTETGKCRKEKPRKEKSGKENFRKENPRKEKSRKEKSDKQRKPKIKKCKSRPSDKDVRLKEKRKSGFGRFLTVLICFLVLIGIVWYLAISGIYGKMEYQNSGQLSGESMKDNGVVNILLIGSDARSSEEAGRSDAMILLSVSPRTKTVHMTSLLRDMYVEIPGHEGNRLNAAYAFGGPELLLETVSLNLDIDVNRYIVVDFQTFANLVDAVGGVDIELSNEEVQWVNAYLNEYNTLRGLPLETDYLDTSLSGVIHLNGPQALAYSRNRYIGSDFGRTERQRKVLGAVADNISSAIISNPMELINGVFSELTTNLSKSECLSLSLMSGRLLAYDIVQGNIPLSGTYRDVSVRGMAVLEVDFDKNREYIRTEIYGE